MRVNEQRLPYDELLRRLEAASAMCWEHATPMMSADRRKALRWGFALDVLEVLEGKAQAEGEGEKVSEAAL